MILVLHVVVADHGGHSVLPRLVGPAVAPDPCANGTPHALEGQRKRSRTRTALRRVR
jgi:hypothetical protein